jgi:uncharacterized protein
MILIDGHNLIGQMPDVQLDDPDDEEKLLARLRAYRACVGTEIVVYFDPGLVYHGPGRRSASGITVRRAGIGQQADDLIVQDVRRSSCPRDLTVVTSDRTIQQVAARMGCQVVDAASFLADMGCPARRKPRRARGAAVREPRLSREEVKEWLKVFRRSAK